MAFAGSSATGVTGRRRALAGFLLSGFLLALLGAILPAWGYHHEEKFGIVGNFFLSLAVGIVAATGIAKYILRRRSVRLLLVVGCVLCCAALCGLALFSPLASPWLRVLGLFALGIGAGLLNMGLFYAISPGYQSDAAGTVNRGGIWYGLGCLLATVFVWTAIDTPKSILLFMVLVPAAFAVVYSRAAYSVPAEGAQPTFRQALRDFRSFGAVLFALLLFVQSGNEWSIAGWLPLFLMRRVEGMTPKGALFLLGLYWFFLMTGRIVAVAILPRVRHTRLLIGSVLTATFGCVLLFSTNNAFGAGMAIFFLGAGYASIYPLVAEAIGRRFPYYHPGFFNGIFSVALVGGLVAPASLGYAASQWGVGVVIGIPLVGMFLVMVLLVLIWLESKVTGR
jgi:fucose permease